ncbi:MAG: glycine cleavage system protein GcvH [Nitrospirae bacterium]|nr:glycine cleavage system protein GcvH [Nitrospirota bacterium]
MYPDDLRYHKDHMWLRAKGNKAEVGITHYAQEQLGDIVYVELPAKGSDVKMNAVIGEIESTKTTSAIEAPVGGRIIETNNALDDTPEVINEDPYGKGWIAVIEMGNVEEVNLLMDSKEYQDYIEEVK